MTNSPKKTTKGGDNAKIAFDKNRPDDRNVAADLSADHQAREVVKEKAHDLTLEYGKPGVEAPDIIFHMSVEMTRISMRAITENGARLLGDPPQVFSGEAPEELPSDVHACMYIFAVQNPDAPAQALAIHAKRQGFDIPDWRTMNLIDRDAIEIFKLLITVLTAKGETHQQAFEDAENTAI